MIQKKKPFFSVIIPTYNQSGLLYKALISVFNQTFKNMEVIVIDNYSTDNTQKLIKKFKKKIIYKKINNGGVIAKSRNLGIKISSGKWIAFLDSDDSWCKNKLIEIYNSIKRFKKYDVICNSEWVANIKKKKIKINSYGPFKKNFYEQLMRYGNVLSTSATVVSKKFIKKNSIYFDENKNFISAEDYDFFLKIANKNGLFLFINRPLGHHLFHNKSISNNIASHLKSHLEVLKNHCFNLQNFSQKKKELWNDILDFLFLKKIIFNLDKKLLINRLSQISFFFIKRPFFFINFFLILLKKKIKNYLIFLFY